MTLAATDLYCGCGGLSAGLLKAGVDVVSAYDNWTPAVETYKRNLNNHVRQVDLSDVETALELIRSDAPDMIAGGPPCQDFSTAGKRVEGKQANLTNVYGELVARYGPEYFLMENVPQVRLSHTYKKIRAMWEKSGYAVAEVVLNASYCRVPQTRKRFFAFGSKKETAVKKFLKWVNENLSDKQLTVKKFLGAEIDIEFYYRHPRNYSRRAIFSVHEPSPTIRGVNRPVPPNYKGNHLDSAPPSAVRPLTSLERSRIQTFPKNWLWGAGDRNADVELQIGNAIPVNLAQFVGRGIRCAIT